MRRLRASVAMGLAAMALFVCLASCADHWFRITDVSASSSESSILHVGVDGCAPSGAPPRLTETDSEIHLLVSQRHGGSELMCLSGFEVRLAHPVGSRKVFDDRRHSVVPVTLALPIPMPAPSWLPHGWTLEHESGAQGNSESTYVDVAGGPSVSIRLTSLADALEQFRGSRVENASTVQGRSAIWAHPVDQPAASALIVHDEHWTLVVQDNDSTVGHDTIERIANSLSPFPFPNVVTTPTLPEAWTGSVADVRGKEGKATVTGWLVIDGSGHAVICDELKANAHECAGLTMIVDWATGNSKPPEDLVARGDSQVSDGPISLSGIAKDDIFFVGL